MLLLIDFCIISAVKIFNIFLINNNITNNIIIYFYNYEFILKINVNSILKHIYFILTIFHYRIKYVLFKLNKFYIYRNSNKNKFVLIMIWTTYNDLDFNDKWIDKKYFLNLSMTKKNISLHWKKIWNYNRMNNAKKIMLESS